MSRAPRSSPPEGPKEKQTTKRLRQPALPQPPTLSISGDFAQNVMVVPTSTTSMLLGTAYIEEERRHVLLPYVEIKIAGIEQGKMSGTVAEADFGQLFSHILPLDNALFMTWDLIRDIRIACTRMQSLSGGGLAMEGVRLAHARNFAERLRGQAELCVAILDELIVDAMPRSQEEESATDDVTEVSPAPGPDDTAAEPKPTLRKHRVRTARPVA